MNIKKKNFINNKRKSISQPAFSNLITNIFKQYNIKVTATSFRKNKTKPILVYLIRIIRTFVIELLMGTSQHLLITMCLKSRLGASLSS